MTKDYVLVTGASSGIGEATVLNLAKQYNIILNGRSESRLLDVKARCETGDHFIWNYDLSQISGMESSLMQFLSQHDVKISYYVHCAGFMQMSPLKMVTGEMLTNTFHVNVFSVALCMKMLTSKKFNDKALRSAVFISSNISNFGAKAMSVYGAAKSGLDGLMRSLAMELAPAVRVNSVLPGGVRTRMTEAMFQNEELITRMAQGYPLGLGDVNDISDAVAFLLSDKARWITGQQLTVDGGRTINITG